MTSPTATAEIERLAREATKGEWLQDQGIVFVDNRAQVCCGQGIEECCGRPDVIGNADMIAQSSPADAAYIAAVSPDVILRLLAEHRAALERAQEAERFANLTITNRERECKAALRAAEAERDGLQVKLNAALGLGCEANNGGEHTVIRQGSYRFCSKCGETIKPAAKARAALQSTSAKEGATVHEPGLCGDCPPVGYPTDKTRCAPCPRRNTTTSTTAPQRQERT